MDLSAYNLQKLYREKRERQPNWTESEKQLLLSLTRMHQSILESKGSDTMTIKRKSEAWDEIAVKMKAAGFNRSKERLKQQLGRIRAAEAKKIKYVIERNLTAEEIKTLNESTNQSIIEENIKCQKQNYNINQIDHSSNNSNSLKTYLPLQEHQYIKSEEASSIEKNDCTKQEVHINSSTYIKPNVINYAVMSSCTDNKNGDSSKIVDNMHFKLQNVQSLAVSNHNIDNDEDGKRICTADVTSTIPCTVSSNIMTSSFRFESNQIVNGGNEENSFSASNSQSQQQNKRRLRSIRANRVRISLTREQGLRQLYMYRAAVERERLRNLRLQQKRDRILYRKDIEIQNLKLQILRNLTNQNRDASSINF